jgi:putative ABC transport system permease protein
MRPGASPSAFLGRLPEIAASVDPALRFQELQTAADVERERRQGLLYLALAVVAVTGSVLLLSAAGIYAMMSFTVARRRREIGIRAALGAAPRRILGAIFARAVAQLGSGMVAGLGVGVVVVKAMGGELLSGESALYMALVVALMAAVGLLAAFVPARRALAIQPTEALREE